MKIAKILTAAALLLTLTACGNSADAAEAAADINDTSVTEEEHDMNTETIYQLTEENVKLLGRTYFDGEKLFCALSGSGADFTFNGTKCSVTVTGDSNAINASNADNQARVAIYVNGERVIDDMVDNIQETYDVFESDTPKDVTISIVKLSESPMSTIGIKEIKATGSKIAPTPNKDLFIEFIGDSITCGYGIDDPDKDHHFSTKTEDVTKAYA